MPIDYERWMDPDTGAQTDVAEQLAQLRARHEQLVADFEGAIKSLVVSMALLRRDLTPPRFRCWRWVRAKLQRARRWGRSG